MNKAKAIQYTGLIGAILSGIAAMMAGSYETGIGLIAAALSSSPFNAVVGR